MSWKLDRKRPGAPLVVDDKLFQYERIDPESEELATETNRSDLDGLSPDAERYVVCREAATADIQWLQPIIAGTPVVVDDHVLAGGRETDGNGTVVAFRVSDGSEAWRHDLGKWPATVSTALNGIAFATTSNSHIRAYAVTDGTLQWERSTRWMNTEVAAAGDTVFSLSSESSNRSVLSARTIDDGSELWAIELEDELGNPRGPVVAGDSVYVAPRNQGVWAFNRETGEERWRHWTGRINPTVAASASTAYLFDREGLHVRDASSGSHRWSVSVGDVDSSMGSLAVDSEMIYAGSDTDLVALSREDGTERWRYRFPEVRISEVIASGLWGQPAIVDGAVYAAAQDGLYRFDAAG